MCLLPHEALEDLAFHTRIQEKVFKRDFASAMGVQRLKCQAQALHLGMRALFALPRHLRARHLRVSEKDAAARGGHIVQARLHATPARRQLLGDAALARRMLVLDCAQGHSQFRSAHLLVQFHRACGAAAGGQKEGASCNLKARSSLPSTGDAIFSAARAAASQRLLSLRVRWFGTPHPNPVHPFSFSDNPFYRDP
jgi:hypothetical protein